MTLQQISKIKHPEIEKPSEETVTTYAKGIVSLFNKTPADIACGKFFNFYKGKKSSWTIPKPKK